VPEYLRSGYRALMAGDAVSAIEQWEVLYARYPSAEVCGHLARAHFYQIYFLGCQPGSPRYVEEIGLMHQWAERALSLNPNSSIGHAMLAVALGREATLTGSQKQIILRAWQVRHHAERAVQIDNHWAGHFVLGVWHRELAGVNPGLKALAHLFLVKLPPASYVDSLRHFQEILRQYPSNNTIYAEMAYTYVGMGEMKRACEMYHRCIEMPLFKHPIAHHLTRAAVDRFGRKSE
jgi:hypothetical protein